MKFQPLEEEEIVRLWAMVLMKQVLPGSELANPLLAKLASDYSHSKPMESNKAATKWLHDQIGHGSVQFLSRVGFKNAQRVRVAARFEVHGLGGYRSLGNQPGALLSGRYGVVLPSDIEPGPGGDDLHPGYISFFDPRSAMNMNAINRDPYLNYHRSIELKPGMLLMWPSHLSYFIHPNLSRTTRISVAFNIYREGGAA